MKKERIESGNSGKETEKGKSETNLKKVNSDKDKSEKQKI